MMSKTYGTNFAFIICAFVRPEFKSHPIGYKHSKLTSDRLFVPTKHEHDGEELSRNVLWDHTIYCFDHGDLSKGGKDLKVVMEKSNYNGFVSPKQTIGVILGNLSSLKVDIPKNGNNSNLIRNVFEGHMGNVDLFASHKEMSPLI